MQRLLKLLLADRRAEFDDVVFDHTFERPMPVMDEYDLLLANTTGGIQ